MNSNSEVEMSQLISVGDVFEDADSRFVGGVLWRMGVDSTVASFILDYIPSRIHSLVIYFYQKYFRMTCHHVIMNFYIIWVLPCDSLTITIQLCLTNQIKLNTSYSSLIVNENIRLIHTYNAIFSQQSPSWTFISTFVLMDSFTSERIYVRICYFSSYINKVITIT